MGFVYKKFDNDKTLLDLLCEAGYNTTRLRRERLLTESAIQDIRNNKVVGIISLEKICSLLDKQPGDIIEFVK